MLMTPTEATTVGTGKDDELSQIDSMLQINVYDATNADTEDNCVAPSSQMIKI